MEIAYPAKNKKKSIHPVAIFENSFNIWRKNLLCLGGIYLLIYAPVTVLSIIRELFFYNRDRAINGIIGLAILIINILISSWGIVAFILAVKQAAEGARCKIIESIKEARVYFLRYLGTMFLFMGLLWAIGIIVGISGALSMFIFLRTHQIIVPVIFCIILLAAVVATVYFTVRLSLGSVVCIMEKKGPISALKRSHYLINQYVTPVVGEYCLLMVLSLVCAIPLALFSGTIAEGARQGVIAALVYQSLINLMLTPLWISGLVVLYHRLKEALD